MMFPSFFGHAGIAVLTAAITSGPTHTWIADIKAQRSSLTGHEVQLEGEVVDVRSTSPTVRRGYYRMTDASDPVGVLVRTEKVPIDGGSFRLRARVAVDQVVNGTLLLDELERDRTDARPLLPIIAVLGSGLALALLVVLFRRAYVEERRFAVAPPLWLLPDAGPYGKALAVGGAPVPLKYDPDLEEADQLQRDRLRRRKRGLLQAMLGSLALTGSSTAWVLGTKPPAGQVPAFIFIDSSDPTVSVRAPQAASVDTVTAEQGARVGGDSALTVKPVTGPDSAPRRAPATVALTPKGTPNTPGTRPAQPAPVDTARDVVPPAPAPSPSPAPAPAPAPAPPPPPPPPEVVAPPPRDPELDRSRAQARVAEAAGRLVAAINARRSTDVALLLPESMAGDLGRRDRFLKLVKDLGPRATLGGVEDATVTDDRGEARFSVSFAWRGDFGVDKKKTGRVQAVVRRDGDGWRFEGARLLDAVP